MREELAGLKHVLVLYVTIYANPADRHIIQELQKENAVATQENGFLKSENKLLLSEAEQLRRVC